MNVCEFHERQGQHERKANERTEELARLALGALIEVHRHLGPGLPAKTYRQAVSYELELLQIPHACEVLVPVYYKGKLVGEARVDILVAGVLVVEIKVVETLTNVHRAQVIAYLQAMKLELGLLVNFNVAILKDGNKRVINTF